MVCLAGLALLVVGLIVMTRFVVESPQQREAREAHDASVSLQQTLAKVAERCHQIASSDPATLEYNCQVLVRARPSGRHVFEVTQVTHAGGVFAAKGRWSVREAPTDLSALAFFANSREYDTLGALAAPNGDGYDALATIFLTQTGQPE